MLVLYIVFVIVLSIVWSGTCNSSKATDKQYYLVTALWMIAFMGLIPAAQTLG